MNGTAAKPKKAIKTEAKTVAPQKPTKITSATGKKRKAAPVKKEEEEEELGCDSHAENADEEEGDKPQPKKRKTKKEKEDEAMPLAERTAIASLKRAMYIGAHVSGAGGKAPRPLPPNLYQIPVPFGTNNSAELN